MYQKGTLSDFVFEKCVRLYNEHGTGKTPPKILKKYSLSPNSLSVFRKINNIEKSNIIKFKCNSDYFTNLDTDFKWYIIGLLYADGNLYYAKQKHGEITLQLQEKDKSILEKIGNEIYKDNYTLYFVKKVNDNSSNNYVLKIRDKQIVKDLVAVGLTPRKSLTLKFPNVPDNYLKPFIQGYIDGDGCLFESENINYASFLSTLEFCQTFKEKINKLLDIKSRINKKENVWKWIIQEHTKLIKFLDWLYSDYQFGLERKYQKYLSIRQNIKNKFNY
jgi:hypothetical protein